MPIENDDEPSGVPARRSYSRPKTNPAKAPFCGPPATPAAAARASIDLDRHAPRAQVDEQRLLQGEQHHADEDETGQRPLDERDEHQRRLAAISRRVSAGDSARAV